MEAKKFFLEVDVAIGSEKEGQELIKYLKKCDRRVLDGKVHDRERATVSEKE